MNEKNIKYKDFRYKQKLNSGSLANALKGKNISLEYAQRMADILGVKVESVFEIKNTNKRYSAYTIDKIKKQPVVLLQWQSDSCLLNTTTPQLITRRMADAQKEQSIISTMSKPNNF